MMELEWDDMPSWSIAGVMTLMYALFAFKASWFDAYPLELKIITLVLIPPVLYVVSYKQLNR